MGDARRLEPEAQGALFESTFMELITRLIRDDLKLTVIDVIEQARGRQGGRDLQVKWRNSAGRTRFWHFECKSKLQGVIPLKEVSDKLMQQALAPHDLDVWCLAASDAEPSNEVDDLINAAPETLSLDFALTAISPSRMGLKWLYSCHPDLYRRQYADQPYGMTSREREGRVERFGEWLEEWSAKRPHGGPSGWTHLTPGRIGHPPDVPQEARTYLRGFTLTCPWTAVIHDWAVPREETEGRLLERVDGLQPGFDHEWLISAGGEGKSTVLRRLVWKLLQTREEVRVLWADENKPAAIETDWLERLASGSRVLMCVDGSGLLSGLVDGLSASDRLAERDVGVLLLMADRGTLWRARRSQQRVPGRARKDPLKLPPLSGVEREELLGRLERHGLLLNSFRPRAATMLAEAAAKSAADVQRNRWGTSWLVPTVLEVVDPEHRPFETILASVLEDLDEAGQENALQLLLAIALLHAAGPGLPSDIAERLLGSRSDLEAAANSLDQELERRLDVAGGNLGLEGPRYVTHGAAVSDGFVRATDSNVELRRRLREICRRLPLVMKDEFNERTGLRFDRFELLDSTVRYLHGKPGSSELAVLLLESWAAVDIAAFLTFNRLGNEYMRWIQEELRSDDATPEELRRLVALSRGAFERALSLAEEVLTKATIPTPYQGLEFGKQQRITYNSWAVLEATIGTKRDSRLGGREHLVQAVFLALLSLEHGDREREAVSTGLLARVLVTLKEFELAAPILAYSASLPYTRKKLVSELRQKVTAAGVRIPEAGVEPFSASLRSVVEQVLNPGWSDLNVKPTVAENQSLLVGAVRRLTSEWPALAASLDSQDLGLSEP